MRSFHTFLSTFIFLSLISLQLVGQGSKEKVTLGEATDDALFQQGTSIVIYYLIFHSRTQKRMMTML